MIRFRFVEEEEALRRFVHNLCIGACVIGGLFLLFVLFVPVRLSVSFSDPFYADEALSSENTTFSYRSLIGIPYPASHVWYDRTEDRLAAYSRGFWLDQKLSYQKPDSLTVSYDGTVYAGQPVDPSKLSVAAVYPDGTSRTVTEVSVTSDPVPMTTHCTIPVETNAGTVSWETDVVTPTDLSASYDETATLGDLFDENRVIFTLTYPDGTTGTSREFSVLDAPEYLSEAMTLTVTSDYGDTELSIVPQNLQQLSVSYGQTVYVGDTLSKEQVSMSMTQPDGTVSPITEFVFPEVGIVRTQTELLLSSPFGDGRLTITPVPVASITADYRTDPLAGEPLDVETLHLTYEDGTVRDVDVSEVTFLKDDLTLQDGRQMFWFTWNGLYYVLYVEPIALDVVSLRDERSSETQEISFATYDLTQEQLSQIAVLCQRLASDDPMGIAMEASLLANRYELYGSDAQDLAAYMVDSGYWGEDAASYGTSYQASELNIAIVEDVLVRGYRHLPLYVDAHAGRSDIQSQNSQGLEVGQTEVTKQDGTVFRYTVSSPDGSLLYGYTDDAYREVTGEVPLPSHPRQPVDTDTEDGISFGEDAVTETETEDATSAEDVSIPEGTEETFLFEDDDSGISVESAQ